MTSSISSHDEYSDQVFNQLLLQGKQIFSCKFFDCQFRDCSFTESVFRKCKFVNSSFINCDASLIQVQESAFSFVSFKDAKVLGVNWAQADWSAPGLGLPIGFIRSRISYSTFIGLSLSGIKIIDCAAIEVDFREADLSQADFSGTDLSKSLFKDTNLTGADLSQARNYDIDPGQNVLRGAKFSMPEAISLLYSMDIEISDED